MDKFLLPRSSSTGSLSGKRQLEDTNPDTWSIPKRIAHGRKQPAHPNINLSNRFKGLPDGNLDDNATTIPHQTASMKSTKSHKVPPIFVELQSNWTHQSVQAMVENHIKRFHMQYRGNGKVAIYCYSDENHQVLKDGLLKDHVAFHIFTRKEEKMAKIIIQGLPSMLADSVSEELSSLGFKNTVVTKLKKATGEESMFSPLLVQLPAGTDIVKFRQIKYLCHCAIQLQRYRPNNSSGTQCYRCQRFGHASRNCNLPERCVKCREPHATKDCPKKDRTTPAACCNCSEDHPANYRKCKERVKYLDLLEAKKTAQLKSTRNPKTSTIDGRAWNVVAATQNIPEPFLVAETTSTKLSSKTCRSEEPQDPVITEMLHILSIIKQIKEKFTSCQTMLDKVSLIVLHLGKYV